MLSDADRQKIINHLDTFKGKESEVKIKLKCGGWSNIYEKAVVEAWIEEREAEREEERQKEYLQLVKEANAGTNKANTIASQANTISEKLIGFNKKLLIASIVAAAAAVISAGSAWISAHQQKLESRAQLSPYVLIKPMPGVLPLNDLQYIVLPYQLENVGDTPALEIRKGYTSYLVDESGAEQKIQEYKESDEKTDALLPSQPSAIHVDNINISGFKSSDLNKKIRVDLEITYQGFSEVDKRVSYSKARLVLIPDKTQSGQIFFHVSQPFLDFGFK